MSASMEAKEQDYIRWVLGAQDFAKGNQMERETLYFLEGGAKLAVTAISGQQLMEDLQAELVMGGVPPHVKLRILKLMEEHHDRVRDARTKNGRVFEKLRATLGRRQEQ